MPRHRTPASLPSATPGRRRHRFPLLVPTSLVLVLGLALGVVAGTAVAGQAPDLERPDEALLEEALGVIGEHFVDAGEVTSEELTVGAIRGMVDALGDRGHTTYLTPEELEVEQDALEGRVVGIGVVVDRRAGESHVISVVDGSPADLAGVRAGDIIVSVDGSDASRLPVDALAALVRGDVGTEVRLGIERPGLPETLELSVVRDDVAIIPASWAFVPASDVALVRIVQFSSAAARVTRLAVEDALEAGARAIVLDLRGNPGGLVDEARGIAGLFLEEGTVYQERDREGRLRPVDVLPGDAIAGELPLVVLVDYGTASSAEILASALADADRATVLGEQTYGTGTVLNTFHLSDGSALRLAVRGWLTPDGADVFGVGVAPDETVELPPGAVALEPGDLLGMTGEEFARSEDEQLRRAIAILGPASAIR